MGIELTPYTVENGNVLKVQDDETGNVYAGKEERRLMNRTPDNVIGFYDDPIRGPKTVADFPSNQLENHALITGNTDKKSWENLLRLFTQQLVLDDEGHGSIIIDTDGWVNFVKERVSDEIFENRVIVVNPKNDEPPKLDLLGIDSEYYDEADFEEQVSRIAERLAKFIRQFLDYWSMMNNEMVKPLIERLIVCNESKSLFDLLELLEDRDKMREFINNYEAERYEKDDELLVSLVEKYDKSDFTNIIQILELWKRINLMESISTGDESGISFEQVVDKDMIVIIDLSDFEDLSQTSHYISALQTRLLQPIQYEAKTFYNILPQFNRYTFEKSRLLYDLHDLKGMMPLLIHVEEPSELQEKVRKQLYDGTEHKFTGQLKSKSDAASVAQFFDVGAEQILGLNSNEIMCRLATDDGYKSEPVIVSLFSVLPPISEE